MHDPERIESEEGTKDSGIDQEQVLYEVQAMLAMVFGGIRRRLRVVRPGDLTTKYESVHDDE